MTKTKARRSSRPSEFPWKSKTAVPTRLGPSVSPYHLGSPGPDAEWTRETARPVSELVVELLGKLRLDESVRQGQLREQWAEIVGDFNAQHTYPESLKRGVLTIRVSTAPLRHQLEMLKVELLKKIQGVAGAGVVKELRLVA